jgi:hypothetical protein
MVGMNAAVYLSFAVFAVAGAASAQPCDAGQRRPPVDLSVVLDEPFLPMGGRTISGVVTSVNANAFVIRTRANRRPGPVT